MVHIIKININWRINKYTHTHFTSRPFKEMTELRAQARKLFWLRVPVHMLGLGLIYLYDIPPYVPNNQVYDKLSGNKDWRMCKHLTNFAAVSLRALC